LIVGEESVKYFEFGIAGGVWDWEIKIDKKGRGNS
jgi:hypothetical protein